MKKLILVTLFIAGFCHAQTTAVLSPVPKQQFFDVNGNPLAGGKLFSYQAGTTTPQNTFTDSTGGTPNANPLILDSGGFGNVWLGSANCYKLVLQNFAGVVQWTIDNICPPNLSAITTLTSATANPATSGFIRMGNTDTICWRNTANTANICFANAGAAAAGTGNIADLLLYGDSSHGGYQAQAFVDTSAAPAQSGVLRCGNNAPCVVQRNAAGSGDITAVQVDASNITNIGGSAGAKFAGPVTGVSTIAIGGGTALATSNQTGTGSLVLATSPTITTPIEIHSTINTGIVNSGTGVMHFRAASCTTVAAGTFDGCNITLNWPGTWADTNYTAVCTFHDGNIPQMVGNYATKTTTTIRISVFKINDGGANTVVSGTIDCIGIHD